MEKEEMISLMDTINQEESSSILGGRQNDYEELERMGYVTINRNSVQYAATLTPLGREYLNQENEV